MAYRSARPSGTDGSDFKYRMVVDKKYQRVASNKKRLYTMIQLQAVHALFFLVWSLVPLLEGQRRPPVGNIIPILSLLGCSIGIRAVGLQGQRKPRLLVIYIVFTAVVSVLCVMHSFVAMTQVHYMEAYAFRLAKKIHAHTGHRMDLLAAIGQIFEGFLNLAGLMVNILGLYLAYQIRADMHAKTN